MNTELTNENIFTFVRKGQSAITCSNLTIETLEQDVKYC